MKTPLFILFALCAPLYGITFEAWVASYSLTGGNAAENADPDADGFPNLLEYALHNGNPIVSGPVTIRPTFGFAMLLADVSYGEAEAAPIPGAPIGVHTALTYQLRSGIEGTLAEAQISMPCPVSGADGSLTRWVGGQSLITVHSRADGKLQAMSRLRMDLLPRSFMRLSVTRGAGFTLPPVEGTIQPTLALSLAPVTLVPRTVGTATTTSVTDRDLTYSQIASPQIVTDVSWPWALGNSGYTSGQVTRTTSASGVLTPTSGDAARWSFVTSGTATMRLVTPARTYERIVSVSSRSSVIERTLTSAATGSLRKHLVQQTDDRAASYANFTERGMLFALRKPAVPSYTRNPNCWVSGVDMSPLAAYNSASSSASTRATLITPRHFIGANHYFLPVGTTLHFVSPGNVITVRTVTDVTSIAGTDIAIGKLNADVPAGIAFARVLPAAWAAKLPTISTFALPVVSTDQGTRVWLRELQSLGLAATCQRPLLPSRLSFYSEAISGDSGSPCFMIVNNAMVLLCTWLSGGGGSGPSITNYRTEINAALTALGGGYQLTDVVLSGFTSF